MSGLLVFFSIVSALDINVINKAFQQAVEMMADYNKIVKTIINNIRIIEKDIIDL